MCDDDRGGGGPRESTLVKYEHPRLISTRLLMKPHPLLLPAKSTIGPRGELKKTVKGTEFQKTTSDICREVLLQQHPEDILGIILPAKEWQEDGKSWKQTVSSVPATKADVIDLFQALDTQMREGSAKETGICPTRRELYSQCFDELIRQVTIICEERGLLLLRVRDEIRITMRSYESLYISATAYAMRRLLMNRILRMELEARTEQLQNEQTELTKTRKALQKELDKVIKENGVIEQREKEARVAELDNLKKINAELKRQKEACMGVKKRKKEED